MRPAPGPRGEVALLLLAGFGFGGGQQVLLREFVSLLYGEEVVLLLVTGAALLAASLGYRLGERLGRRALVGLLLGCAALQLLSPVLPRLVVAGLCWLRGGTGPELVAVLAGFAFVAAAPFAALLPALLRERGSAGERLAALRRGYTAELLGFAVGAATATMLGGLPDLRLGLHALALVAIVRRPAGLADVAVHVPFDEVDRRAGEQAVEDVDQMVLHIGAAVPTFVVPPIDTTASLVVACMAATCAEISSVALAVWLASAFTSDATTAKPRLVQNCLPSSRRLRAAEVGPPWIITTSGGSASCGACTSGLVGS